MDLGPAGRGGARRRTRRRMNARQSAMSNSSAQQPPVQPAPESSPAHLLEMLKTLHTAGILTDEEFNAKKLQIVDLM